MKFVAILRHFIKQINISLGHRLFSHFKRSDSNTTKIIISIKEYKHIHPPPPPRKKRKKGNVIRTILIVEKLGKLKFSNNKKKRREMNSGAPKE